MKRKRITCKRVRQISVMETLAQLGHFPIKESEKEAWFLSILRSETQASFKVSKVLNRWYDHSTGVGGNIIDLIVRIKHCSVKEALEFLTNDIIYFSFQQRAVFEKIEPKISIIKVHEIRHPALIQYLISRKITLTTARKYCKEVWYEFNGKKYFAIGLQNSQGGWELRNKYFKNSSSPKSYTYLKNSENSLVVLEGMFDLLSLVELNCIDLTDYDFIILNSTAFVKSIVGFFTNYDKVNLFLDNDATGKKITMLLTQNYAHVIDQSFLYKNYKDLNEWSVDGRKI
jgi:DNA primase